MELQEVLAVDIFYNLELFYVNIHMKIEKYKIPITSSFTFIIIHRKMEK